MISQECLRRLLLIGFGLIESAYCQNRGALHLRVLDTYGNPVSPTEIRLVNSSTGGVFSPPIARGIVRDVPYGDYKIRIHVPGFSYWNSSIRIEASDAQVTAVMQLGPYEGIAPNCSAFGTVAGISAASIEQARLRLLPVFANESFESNLSSAGEFKISNVVCGSYILVVVANRDILWSEPILLSRLTGPLMIKIGKVEERKKQ